MRIVNTSFLIILISFNLVCGTAYSEESSPWKEAILLLEKLQNHMTKLKNRDKSQAIDVDRALIEKFHLLVGLNRKQIESHLGEGQFAPYDMKDFCIGGNCRMYMLSNSPPRSLGGEDYLVIKYDKNGNCSKVESFNTE